MKKFMALYLVPAVAREQAMKDVTPEETRGQMKLWEIWLKENEGSIVDGGDPLGKTKRASANGVVDVKNEVAGYSIVQAESHEEAMKLFGHDHPHFNFAGATIEVMEIIPVPAVE